MQAQMPAQGHAQPLKTPVPLNLKQVFANQLSKTAENTGSSGSSGMTTELQQKDDFVSGRTGGARPLGRPVPRGSVKEKDKKGDRTEDAKKAGKKNINKTEDKNYEPVNEVLERFSDTSDEDARGAFDAELTKRKKSPLDRFQIYQEAYFAVDELDLPEDKKDEMRLSFNEMMSVLQEKYGDEIRAGIQEIEHVNKALSMMMGIESEGRYPTDLEMMELRRLEKGRILDKFTELGVIKSLKKRYKNNLLRAARMHMKYYAAKL